MKAGTLKKLALLLLCAAMLTSIAPKALADDEVPEESTDDLLIMPAPEPEPPEAPKEPRISARSAVVMDFDTGEVLYGKDENTLRAPASMTKIMTAYIIFQELDAGNLTLDSIFTISDNARRISRDSSYPTAVPLVGDEIDLDTLIRLILIPSASASCIVAAENIAGSEEAFVERMNENARRLGMEGEYQNCHGARSHYLSAWSIAHLIRTFITEYPQILEYTSLREVRYNGHTYKATNLLYSTFPYEGADGFKTGTTGEAGYCFSGTAKRDGRRMISVVMHSGSNDGRYKDTRALLDYGFAEAARREFGRAHMKAEITANKPLRAGATVPVTFTATNVPVPFYGLWTVSVDGAPVDAFYAAIDTGFSIDASVTLPASAAGKSTATVTVTHNGPNGITPTFTASLPVSELPAPAFSDIAWCEDEDVINDLTKLGYLHGCDDGLFHPGNEISRAEFVSIAARVAHAKAPEAAVSPFTDVDELHWAYSDICALAAMDVVHGDAGEFMPTRSMTREEAAVIVFLLLKPISGGELTGHFTDSADISEWAAPMVEALAEAGVIPAGSAFRPQDLITRAESVRMLNEVLTKAGTTKAA